MALGHWVPGIRARQSWYTGNSVMKYSKVSRTYPAVCGNPSEKSTKSTYFLWKKEGFCKTERPQTACNNCIERGKSSKGKEYANNFITSIDSKMDSKKRRVLKQLVNSIKRRKIPFRSLERTFNLLIERKQMLWETCSKRRYLSPSKGKKTH